MGFKNRTFNKSTYPTESIDENKFIIIACEGSKTEIQYFNLVKDNLDLKKNIKIEILERDKDNETSSAPTRVIETFQLLTKEKLKEIKKKNLSEDSYDIYWAVVDREKQESKKVNLRKAIEICKEEQYSLALTNPTFEFWLLLHFKKILELDRKELYDNKKITNKKRFLEIKLKEILGHYNKNKIKKEDFITLEKIKVALEQEKLFENKLENIIDKLGSNVGELISLIIEIED